MEFKTISLAKTALIKQFSLIDLLCCDTYHKKLYFNKAWHFLYSVTFHYSSVDLQRNESILAE